MLREPPFVAEREVHLLGSMSVTATDGVAVQPDLFDLIVGQLRVRIRVDDHRTLAD